MLERNGKVRSMKVDNVGGKVLKPIIYQNVNFNATIMSDEWLAYNGLNNLYKHEKVDMENTNM